MIYPMIFISLFLLSGCSTFSKPKPESDCVELIREARRAHCQIQTIIQDDYMDQCAVACK